MSVRPNNVTSDCMHAEQIYIEIEHDRPVRTLHVTEVYPVAWSEEMGLLYHGTLSLTVVHNKNDEAMAVVTYHWLRDDGFGVHIVQQLRLRYPAVDGRSQIKVVREHNSFTCH